MGQVVHGMGPAGTPWTAYHAPAANTALNVAKAAVTGRKNVCTAISFGVITLGTAPAAATLIVRLRDGATGAGNVLAEWSFRIPATTNLNICQVSLDNLWIMGSSNTAMCLETSAATGANVQAYGFLTGAVV